MSAATANDCPQHAGTCHILHKLASIMIKVGTLLQDEGPWTMVLNFFQPRRTSIPPSS